MNYGDDIEKGFESAQKAAEKAQEGISKSVEKAAADIEKMAKCAKDAGKAISLGVAGGIAENDKFVTQSFNAMLEKLNYQRKLDLINDDEYYTQLESLRDRYFAAGTKEWVKYTEQIYAYQKELLEEEKKRYRQTYEDIFSYAEEKIDAVLKKQEEYEKKLKTSARLFNRGTIEYDGGTMEFYTLADLKKENAELESYVSALADLKRVLNEGGASSEVTEDIIGQINSLSLSEGKMALKAISAMDGAHLAEWVNEYQKRVDFAKSASASFYGSEMDSAMEDVTYEMKQRLCEAGFEIPETFFDAGKDSALKFGEAFSAEIESVLSEIKLKLDGFNASLKMSLSADSGIYGSADNRTYKTYNETYNISAQNGADAVSELKRYSAIRRLAGVEG